MEKLGVVVNKPGEKLASETKTCPNCLAVLEENVNVSKCKNCGTIAFEEKDDAKAT
jgi:ribosomal protein S27AE